jgi:thiol-disulfide isomerase/thioredoxin
MAAMKKIFLLALAALAFHATAATLSIGDPAPDLKVFKWVKDTPVDALDTNKIYVVEFWATWCGPCRVSIPHLTEMAHKFTSVTFVGMDISERVADKEAAVTKFVKQMGDQMDYHVAMDTEDKFMAENWMQAAGQNGIPTAFVVQSGRIAWIGHPMEGLEEALTNAVAGKLDVEKAKQRSEAMKKIEALFQKAMQGGDEAELLKEGKELETLDQQLGGVMPGGKKFDTQDLLKQAKFQKAMQAYQKAVLAGDDDADVATLEADAKAAAPKEMDFDAIKTRLQEARSSQQAGELFQKYSEAVGENGDKDKAADLAKQLGEVKIKNAQTLNDIAWTILTGENIKQRDLPLATKFAKAAVAASDGKDAAILDTYGRALFDSGNVTEAVEIQTKAVAACEDATMKSELETALKKYQAAAAEKK